MNDVWTWVGSLHSDTRELIKASLAPTVAILLFVLTNVIQIVLAALQRRSEIRRIVTGIYREILHNLENQQKLLVSLDVIVSGIKDRLRDDEAAAKAAGKEPTYRPLLAITESSRFFEAVAASMPLLASQAVVPVSYYYRKVDDEKVLVKSVESYAFLHITVTSRCEIIDELLQAFKDAQTAGQAAIAGLEKCYPHRWFKA